MKGCELFKSDNSGYHFVRIMPLLFYLKSCRSTWKTKWHFLEEHCAFIWRSFETNFYYNSNLNYSSNNNENVFGKKIITRDSRTSSTKLERRRALKQMKLGNYSVYVYTAWREFCTNSVNSAQYRERTCCT